MRGCRVRISMHMHAQVLGTEQLLEALLRQVEADDDGPDGKDEDEDEDGKDGYDNRQVEAGDGKDGGDKEGTDEGDKDANDVVQGGLNASSAQSAKAQKHSETGSPCCTCF